MVRNHAQAAGHRLVYQALRIGCASLHADDDVGRRVTQVGYRVGHHGPHVRKARPVRLR